MTTVETAPVQTTEKSAEGLVERLFGAMLATMDVHAAYLGNRLGYYRILAEQPVTSSELAARSGTAERYAREWLEQQAVTGILDTDADVDAFERRYTLPAAYVGPLVDAVDADHFAPFLQFVVGAVKQTERLVEAFRTGGGVSWAELGTDARQGQGGANRALFLGPLGREYLPSIPDVNAALRAGGRVADVGCGVGWSSIGIALAYPDATVDGYDAVFAFECIHDLSDPVAVLAAMRRLAGDRGTVIVMDERVAETFTAPGDEVERMMYGYSLMCCLADGMSHQPSAATGTVMRPSTLRGYAAEAGFADVEVLDIANDFFRFYRLG
jgi:SAM-dependent methyltransferase